MLEELGKVERGDEMCGPDDWVKGVWRKIR